MKCRFDYYNNINDKLIAFLVIVCFLPLIFYAFSNNDIFVAMYLVSLPILFFALLKSKHSKGTIRYKQEGIEICRLRGKREIPRFVIEFYNIEDVFCQPEVSTENHQVVHTLVFTVILETGKKFAFYKRLDVEKDLPVRQPEKFKEYIDEQPMMKLYEYIKRKVG